MEVRRLRGYFDLFICQACLRSWRGTVARADHRLGIHLLRLQIQLHSADITRLRTQAHTLARRDKQHYFGQLLEEATAHWHETGRPLESTHRLSWASKTAKQKRDVRAASGYDIDLELQAQFQSQEAGQAVSSSQLHIRFSAWEATPKPPCTAAAPTLLDLEALCRAQKPQDDGSGLSAAVYVSASESPCTSRTPPYVPYIKKARHICRQISAALQC